MNAEGKKPIADQVKARRKTESLLSLKECLRGAFILCAVAAAVVVWTNLPDDPEETARLSADPEDETRAWTNPERYRERLEFIEELNESTFSKCTTTMYFKKDPRIGWTLIAGKSGHAVQLNTVFPIGDAELFEAELERHREATNMEEFTFSELLRSDVTCP